MATSAMSLLDIESVGPLTPVCQAFKALVEAAEGTAQAQQNLREVVSWCAFLIRAFMNLGKTVGGHSDTDSSLRDFASTTDTLAKRAKIIAARQGVALLLHAQNDAREIADFEVKLRDIWAGVRARTRLGMRERLEEMRSSTLEGMATIPASALALPDSHVERTALIEGVVRALAVSAVSTSSGPHLLVGMGGGGKTVLASAVVRHDVVRKHFRRGIFWIRVGTGGKNQLLTPLQGLAREVGVAPTGTPHGEAHGFNSLEEVVRHLTAVARKSTTPCLVVLDDVCEREVVDALVPTGLVLLVTTRVRSVAAQEGYTEVGSMTTKEAVTLLGRASGSIGSGAEVRAGMEQVKLTVAR